MLVNFADDFGKIATEKMMAGLGSGRRNQSGKHATEDSRPLDIRKLQRAGLLKRGQWFGWQWTINDKMVADIRVRVEANRVVLVYRYRRRGDVDWQDVEQPVYLDHTDCTYGGTRPWWVCPSCGRRVAILYGPGKLYGCRHCYQLAYSCQRETADDRAARRADTIRRRLSWRVGILNARGGKPKSMHWQTFERLARQHDSFVGTSFAGMAERLGILNRRLVGIQDDLSDDG
jgi:hypothetical protein